MDVVRDAVLRVVCIHSVRNHFLDLVRVCADVFQTVLNRRERRGLALLHRLARLEHIAFCIKQLECECGVPQIRISCLLRLQYCFAFRCVPVLEVADTICWNRSFCCCGVDLCPAAAPIVAF